MNDRRSTRALGWLERTLFVVGVACLGYYGYRTLEAHQFQREQSAALEQRLEESAAPVSGAGETAGAASDEALPLDEAPGVWGLLEIPRLEISAAVKTGDDPDTLDVAVGHLPDTPTPWESGNSALAAHRDGLFRPLKDIEIGDEVRLRTTRGEFVYRVSETKIVMPDDLSVLAPTEQHSVTLITCYPFNFIGNAPKRFIVHAERQ